MGGGHPWSLVTADLEALLTALYVLTNDHVIPCGEHGPGRSELSGAELTCLTAAQVLLGARSEHHWLRMCYARPGHLLPPTCRNSPDTASGSKRQRCCWPR